MSRAGLSRSQCAVRGFTLIELMVVLVIIGIVVTFVTLSIGADPQAKNVETEARRLAALMELASEESVLHSSELAIRFTDTDYAFFSLQNGQWQTLEDDPQLRQRQLPHGMSMKLTLDEAPPFDLTAEKDEQPPQVFLLSSGEMTPFSVEFRADATERRYQVSATLTGKLAVEQQ